MAAGLPTPGSSESHRTGIAVEAEMKRAGGMVSNKGGGRGNSGGDLNARSDLLARPVEASGVVSQSREGTPLTNPACISDLTLRPLENTRDVLSKVELLTL